MYSNKKQRKGNWMMGVDLLARAARVTAEQLEGRTLFSQIVSGHVYADADNDGLYDSNEGIGQWPVQAYHYGSYPGAPDWEFKQTRTDSSGYYSFDLEYYDNSIVELSTSSHAGYLIDGSGWETHGFSDLTKFDFAALADPNGPPKPEDTKNCNCKGVSDKPVRYADGQVYERSVDLASDGYGTGWSHTRGWSNNARYDRGSANGNGWVMSETPTLTQQGDDVAIILSSTTA